MQGHMKVPLPGCKNTFILTEQFFSLTFNFFFIICGDYSRVTQNPKHITWEKKYVYAINSQCQDSCIFKVHFTFLSCLMSTLF